MLDIIVTTPKSEHENAKMEADVFDGKGGGIWFRSMRGKPKQLDKGDRMYYVDGGVVTGYGIVIGIEYRNPILDPKVKCDVTNKTWRGPHFVCMRSDSWVGIEVPVEMKGFQGFRYVDRIDGLREKLKMAEA